MYWSIYLFSLKFVRNLHMSYPGNISIQDFTLSSFFLFCIGFQLNREWLDTITFGTNPPKRKKGSSFPGPNCLHSLSWWCHLTPLGRVGFLHIHHVHRGRVRSRRASSSPHYGWLFTTLCAEDRSLWQKRYIPVQLLRTLTLLWADFPLLFLHADLPSLFRAISSVIL